MRCRSGSTTEAWIRLPCSSCWRAATTKRPKYPALKRDVLVRHARARGAAELMVPAEILLVAGLPLLGTGKPDYVAATALAKEKLAAEPKANASGVAA